ncbi:transcriptional regulator [Streptomyces sp. YC504]|uniref:Transcriptional regulator n=1 Tax=Streptomyces mesophilus TaxID=1775132 RepID=A0A6G4XB68_9ACTN|nr:transcriptional regulator [Streptomyces mesophilus]NGO74402.1 transcriptional regulator [Streptomyces mesophilus]
MPERTQEFGKYGARGAKGSELVGRKLDDLAGYFATPVTAPRGLMARLHYLTRTANARNAARAAGLTVTDRTLKAWLDGKRSPSARNLQKIEAVYRTVRRHNVAAHLLKRLNRAGRGTRVEIHPLNQSGVSRPQQRVVPFRDMNVRRWDAIVAAWAAGDAAGLDTAWTDHVLPDLGSEYGAYEYCTAIGFAA